jgi:hypothetical protein
MDKNQSAVQEDISLAATRGGSHLTNIISRSIGVIVALVAGFSAFLLPDYGITTILGVDVPVILLAVMGGVALVAAFLFRSWWAVLWIPLVSALTFFVVGTIGFTVAGAIHGGTPNPNLPLLMAAPAFTQIALPAVGGAVLGTLLWQGWVARKGH